MQTKYVVVIGSLLSGIGKGVVTASITKILGMYGYNAMPLKFDGYLNYDCGTMNPYRHGEVFVLEDGSEVDMDFGEYERFIDRDFNNAFSLTGGKVFSEIISNERKGKFLGRDVQIIPHVTDFIIDRVEKTAEDNKLEVMVIEVGGTVGDIENSYFVEAMRQLALKRKVVFVNTTFVPELETVGEQKTKPTQIAMRGLMQAGIQPNFIVCRSKNKLTAETRNKIAYFANLPKEAIIDDHDLENIYRIPLDFIRQGFDKLILSSLELDGGRINKEELESWDSNSKAINAGNDILNIAIVGKYMSLHDSYKSVKEAIVHSAASNNVKVNLNWIESEELEGEGEGRIKETLGTNDGIIVPGGFGGRGIEGMINTVRYCRENGVPYLGLCLGMQVMAIEFARNVCNIEGSNSAEFDKGAENKIIVLMDDQKKVIDKGGTMRLGSFPAKIKEGTEAYKAYGSQLAHERHRHRYEFNNDYREAFENKGMVVSGTSPDGKLVEMLEWKGQFGIGTQAHPELKSRLVRPAPLFNRFIHESRSFHLRRKDRDII